MHSQEHHHRQLLLCCADALGGLLDERKLTSDMQMLLEQLRKEGLIFVLTYVVIRYRYMLTRITPSIVS